MQVMRFWKEEIGRPDDNLIHPDTNLRYGCHILCYYLDREAQHLSCFGSVQRIQRQQPLPRQGPSGSGMPGGAMARSTGEYMLHA